ncbi:putative phage DNA-binding protein [Burkholderia thailandensis E254]|uniref:hypothetical protein n=1 Tax=Burkholderia thailandensis TaxID=57975 RepID=UPI00051530EB|nr:hypothetical protein [Burkholderia thailandensis]AIS97209.1 putative phage DNA-binding protein [Burkholderia thailandensis MSMB59]AIT19318.1 putative phage DNA-binding protein [Burkholderia thailandensis E254]AOJ44861.1 hypothetical protein WJ27_06905 [Burkholderia thailandensis]KVG16625.1 hypothetical protein WJ28_12475 [Burkholderia thailandensis]MUV28858.1 hypothetical protein [Burkholderia thailandensis]
MKTKNGKLTINAVLGAMRPGSRYTANRLAEKLGAPLSSVRQLLATDVALARLDSRSSHRGREYSLAGTCRAPDAHVDTRIRPDFTSNLSGYMAELNTRRALAMMTRGGR